MSTISKTSNQENIKEYNNIMKRISENKLSLMIYEGCAILTMIGYIIEFERCRKKSGKREMNNCIIKNIWKPDGTEIYNYSKSYPRIEINAEDITFNSLFRRERKNKMFTVDYKYESGTEPIILKDKELLEFQKHAPLHIIMKELTEMGWRGIEMTVKKIPAEDKKKIFSFQIKNSIQVQAGYEFFKNSYEYGKYIYEYINNNKGGIIDCNIWNMNIPEVNLYTQEYQIPEPFMNEMYFENITGMCIENMNEMWTSGSERTEEPKQNYKEENIWY